GTPGFGGHGYARREVGRSAYADAFDDYLAFLSPRLGGARELRAAHAALDARSSRFDGGGVDREPYMAPGLVGPEKAARGKRPTDVWWHTIVPTNGAEKTGYPTQKPEGVLRRIVAASARPGGWCLDPFAGSGTLGAVFGQP